MKREKREYMIVLSTIFLILLAVSAIWIYLSLSEHAQREQFVLEIRYNNETMHYTMSELKNLPVAAGYGGIRKSNNYTEGPFTCKGLPIKYIINKYNISGNYSIKVKYDNGLVKEFSKDMVDGKVDVYDSKGRYIGVRNLVLTVIYEKNGLPVGEKDGPLQIGFISDEGIFFVNETLWLKHVYMITIET